MTQFKLQNKETLTITTWDVECDDIMYTITYNPDPFLSAEWTIISDFDDVDDNELKNELITFCKSNNQ